MIRLRESPCFHGPIVTDHGLPIEIHAAAAQFGDNNALHYNVTMAGAPAARSPYPYQVGRIAPESLFDREGELAELAAWCTAPGTGSYVWWRAGPWAGKSALLSWFVLHPPPGIRVVSFFVTARFAGQNDRIAFATVILEQLAEVMHQPAPALIGEASRDAHVMAMLAEAAAACARDGDRLVLVVDGLDEDRGTIEGADAYSIAAMLPARPPSGLRIIVAGRPNPPIPDDVPPGHPLRDPAIVRELADSPHAREIRTEAERELERLIEGPDLERDVLGLLAAAGGGLSVPDLVELTGTEARLVERLLRRVSGRTFLPRVSTWRPATAPDVYVLGHEELQRTALRVLSGDRLAGHREDIHRWADGYRAQGWPEGTPEYLVRGYTSLLEATGELARMIRCAGDGLRHDRMLEITGGDTAALAEIAAAQDRIIGGAQEPDLAVMARLARRRDELAERNAKTPIEAPAVWAMLGHVGRAEAMTQSIPDPFRRACALAELVGAVSVIGDRERVETLADWAADAAESVADHCERTLALAAVIAAVTGHAARAGAPAEYAPRIRALADRAVALAPAVPDQARLEQARTRLAESLADAREPDRIKAASAATYDRYLRARSRAALAKAYAVMGLREKAATGLRLAADLSRKLPAPADQARALAYVADATTAAGDPAQAGALLDEARSQAEGVVDDHERAAAFDALVLGAVAAGDEVRAERLTYAIPQPDRGPALLARVRGRTAAAGPDDEAQALALAAGGVAGAMARAVVARALRAADDRDGAKRFAYEAEALIRAAEHEARAVPDPRRDADVLIQVANALVAAGSPAEAAAMCARTAALLDAAGDAQAHRLELARTLVAVGDHAEGERLAALLEDPADRNRVRLEIVAAVAATGDFDRAGAAARTLSGAEGRAAAYAAVSRAAIAAGAFGRARAVVASMTGPVARNRALIDLIGPLVAAGHHGEAADVVDSIQTPEEYRRAVETLRTATLEAITEVAASDDDAAVRARLDAIDPPELWAEARAAVLAARPIGGDAAGAAAALIGALEIGEPRARCAVRLIEAVARSGDRPGARVLAARAEREIGEMPNQPRRAPVYAALAKAIDAIGDHAAAVATASAIINVHERVDALLAIARSAVVSGALPRAADVLHQAEQAAQAIQRPDKRDAALAGVVTLLVGAAAAALTPDEAEVLAERSETVASRVAGVRARAEALAGAAAAFVAAAMTAVDPQRSIASLEHAAALARSGADAERVEAVLTAAARETALSERPDLALALARTIPEPDRQAVALCRVAGQARPGPAVRFVAWAFRLGHWTIPLEALARVRPAGLHEFVGELRI